MKINLSEIRIDGGTQSRVAIDQQVVEDYAEAIKVGIKFPEVTLFFDGAVYWLVDGFHRYHAHRYAKKTGIDAIAINGTQREAILYSVGANSTHGLRRSNEDKRKAVSLLLNDAEWSAWSDRKIAEQCAVGHALVSNMRAEMAEAEARLSVHGRQIDPVRKVERNGTTYEQNTANIGRSAALNHPGNEHLERRLGDLQDKHIATMQALRKAEREKPETPDDPGMPDAVELLEQINAENLLLQARIEALSTDDQAKKIDELVRLNDHYRREKDVEMDKNALLHKERDQLSRWQSQVVEASGAGNPKAALQWVKMMAQRRAA